TFVPQKIPVSARKPRNLVDISLGSPIAFRAFRLVDSLTGSPELHALEHRARQQEAGEQRMDDAWSRTPRRSGVLAFDSREKKWAAAGKTPERRVREEVKRTRCGRTSRS